MVNNSPQIRCERGFPRLYIRKVRSIAGEMSTTACAMPSPEAQRTLPVLIRAVLVERPLPCDPTTQRYCFSSPPCSVVPRTARASDPLVPRLVCRFCVLCSTACLEGRAGLHHPASLVSRWQTGGRVQEVLPASLSSEPASRFQVRLAVPHKTILSPPLLLSAGRWTRGRIGPAR